MAENLLNVRNPKLPFNPGQVIAVIENVKNPHQLQAAELAAIEQKDFSTAKGGQAPGDNKPDGVLPDNVEESAVALFSNKTRGKETPVAPVALDISQLSHEKRLEVIKAIAEYNQTAKTAAPPTIMSDTAAAQALAPVQEPEYIGEPAPAPGKEPEPGPEEDIDIEDVRAYTQCMLGGLPFRRQFTLMGGNCTVVFVELTSKEQDAINDIAARKAKISDLATEHQYDRFLEASKFYASIESIELTNGKYYQRQLINTDCDSTWLDVLSYELTDGILHNPGFRGSLKKYYYRFKELLELLEAKADYPNFTLATD